MARRRRSPGGYRITPVKVGEEYDVVIESIGSRGDGVARIQGFIVFVPGSRVGDHLRVKIESVSRRFAVASTVE